MCVIGHSVGDGGGWYGIRDNVVGSLVEQQAGGGGNVGDYLTHLTNLYSTILVKCVEPSNVGIGCSSTAQFEVKLIMLMLWRCVLALARTPGLRMTSNP